MQYTSIITLCKRKITCKAITKKAVTKNAHKEKCPLHYSLAMGDVANLVEQEASFVKDQDPICLLVNCRVRSEGLLGLAGCIPLVEFRSFM